MLYISVARSWLHSSFPDLPSKGCAGRGGAKLSSDPFHVPPQLPEGGRCLGVTRGWGHDAEHQLRYFGQVGSEQLRHHCSELY